MWSDNKWRESWNANWVISNRSLCFIEQWKERHDINPNIPIWKKTIILRAEGIGKFIRDNPAISTNLYQSITNGIEVKTLEEMAYEYSL